jgi:hypothetical protein
MLKLAAHPVAYYCATDLTPDHKAGSRSSGPARPSLSVGKREMDDEPRASRPPAHPHGGGELGALAQPGRGRKHGTSRFRATSGRKALTALPTTGCEDGATGAGAHAQPKAVGLCAPAVVRLERALAHSRAPRKGQVRPGIDKCAGRRSEGTPTVRGHRRHGQTWCRPRHDSSTTSGTTQWPQRTQVVENSLKHKPGRC